jgi:hypothetical protein
MNAFSVVYNSHSPAAHVCTSYITLPFMWYFYIQTSMSLRVLTQYFQTHLGIEVYYLLFILPFYDRKCIVYLYMSFIHSSTWRSGVILKHNGFSFMFNSSEKTLENGILLFDQPHIHICCECILLFLRNMFKFLGHTQFLQICTTSKEIMLFHDNGFVLLRFARGFN